LDVEAVAGVAGDDVAEPGVGPADGVAVGPVDEAHADAVVQLSLAAGVGADEVTSHGVVARVQAVDRDAGLIVARNDVTLAGAVAALGADAVALAADHGDAAAAVGQGGSASGVGADVVSADPQPVRDDDVDAVAGVAGDDVALGRVVDAVAVGADQSLPVCEKD